MNQNVDIIVPVFNVEQYLPKCIESLINQTYDNYKITLIDDGSTDNSGLICDMYSFEYPDLIKVYHKNNGGLSDARNFGVRNTKYEYIIFVDSDDFVGETFIEDFVVTLEKYNCDMVVTPLTKVYNNEAMTSKNYGDIVVMDKFQALEESCYEELFGNYAVSKLFRRETVERYPFPLNRLFEDSYTTYKYIYDSDRIVYLNKSNYFYLQRDGSIQRSDFKLNHIDLIYATNDMLEFFKRYNMPTDIINAGKLKLYKSCHITLLHAIESNHYDYVFEIVNCTLEGVKFNSKNLSKKQVLIYKFLIKNKYLYKCFYNLKKAINL